MDRLKGKKALVLGGSTGIGAEVCRLFAKEGADVAVTSSGHEDERAHLAEEITSMGRQALNMTVNVLYEDQIVAAMEETIRQFGHVDILVNNAGSGGHYGPIWTETLEEFESLIKLNLTGVWLGMRHVLPHGLERRYGRILNTASQLAHKPAPENATSSVTKAGIVALTAAVALEVADKGVTVNAVCPGPTDTPLWRSVPEEWREWKAESLPMKRVGTCEEQAWAFVYLASDEASYVTGQSISPNGGDTMW